MDAIVTIADLAHVSGKYIAKNMMTGKWQGGRNLLWPQISNQVSYHDRHSGSV